MKWSVGYKIASMNAIAIIALLTLGLCSYFSTNNMISAMDWRQHSYKVKDGLHEILALLVDTETAQRGYMLSNNENYLQPYKDALSQIDAKFKLIRSLTGDNIEQQHNLDELAPLVNMQLSNVESSIHITDKKQELLILDNGKKIMDHIRSIMSRMNSNEDTLLTSRLHDAANSVMTTLHIIIYGTILSILSLVAIGYILTKNIVKPLNAITSAAQKISIGEIDATFKPLKRQDEIGVLSKSFYKMSKSLEGYTAAAVAVSKGDLTVNFIPQSTNDVLGTAIAKMVLNLQIFTKENKEVVEQLNTSVNEIFTSVSELVSSGSETATAVSETTSTIEEVRQTSLVSNEKAKSVSEDAQTAAQISQSGKKSTQETYEGMTRIRDQMLSIADSMMMLSEQTQGIGTIVETVDDLAQQSNLLSVNASIEAEKAGDQGKGFRIVAQEIKNLADQSKQATHRVREILLDVQKATSTAVLATEQGNKVAEGGVKKSEEAGQAISKLSNTVIDAAQTAIQIAASSQQQVIGMGQAAFAMENIKQASTQNVDSAKQLELAAHNLKKLGVKLEGQVKKYKVSEENMSSVDE
jgi:methyl-accepting chemotaxis protein